MTTHVNNPQCCKKKIRLSKNKKFFILLSLIIALIDGLLVTNNHLYSQKSFEAALQEESRNDYAIYETILESTYNGLSLQATLFANDERIQTLFLQGKKALEIEGGDAGGKKTAEIRKKLYQLIAKPWKNATKKFDVRQLQFHLGPGSLSFLRVHKPEKFGDRMDELRFIIVDTNAERTARTGFETGRIYSGLRSVAPVFSWDQALQKEVYVGALEVGTSYKKLLETIDQNINIELSILLNNQHIKQTVWDEFITGNYNNNTISDCNCILEASSRPDQEAFLSHVAHKTNSENQSHKADSKARVVYFSKHYYSYTFYPFRDYIGTKMPSRDDIGAVFIARNIDKQISLYKEEQWFNIFHGIIAFIIVEFLLFLTFLKVTKNLTAQVKIQTKELLEQKRVIELDKIKYKNLSDAINESYFFYARDKNNVFSYVSSSITQVLGFTKKEFLEKPWLYISKNAHSDFIFKKTQQTILKENQNTFEVEIYNKSGRIQYLLLTEAPEHEANNQKNSVEGMAQDITKIRQDKMLFQLQSRILHLISENHPQKEILAELAKGVEDIIQDINCAIMLYDKKNKKLSLGAAPNLTPDFKEIINKLDVRLLNNACSIAINTVKRKIISDIHASGIYNISQIFQNSSYKACCSEPILSSNADVLATIDLYFSKICTPDESDFIVLRTATDLISILFESNVN